jgi:type III pantothenate kinase
MLLALDAGNTNITIGIFDGDHCAHFWRIASDSRRTENEYALILNQLLEFHGVEPASIDGVVLGSVVPMLSVTLSAALAEVLTVEPFEVTHDARLPVSNRYAKPREVGIDRLANAAGGVKMYGAPVVIVDLGTTVTLDVISKRKEYRGGAILPGIDMSANALARGTARLPLIAPKIPPVFIGRTTAESIRSGILNGLVGSIDYLIDNIWKELGYRTATVATGGLASVITQHSKRVKNWNAELTLLGLKLIFELNQNRRKPSRTRS